MSTHAKAANLKEKKKTLCGACDTQLEPDHPGIQCPQGHHYCTECSQQIVSLFLSDPQSYIPLRCVQCHVELNTSVFERQLTPAQMEFYYQNMLVFVWVKELVGPDERLDNCPFCSYAIIRGKNDPHLFFCERPDCHKTSCLICRKACPSITNDYLTEAQQEDIFQHFTCAELADDKSVFDLAVENGQKVACPQCGLAGMKDDSCTHMTCPTCSQIWCYFCGKRLEDCDKAPNGHNSIIDHNHDWEKNSKRCPMYFMQIEEFDKRWPEDEAQCLMMFHRNRSLRLLREVFEKLGKDRIEKLNHHFHVLDSCGFSVEEILNEDLTLIQGRDRVRRRNHRN
ncbi:unnamed protein product [Adineta steineri]|uniref:RING-type domain-containing protein n=1 Tax=Adineta steineri TaxID=433720 RepID=A0A813RIH8_9BILA|nr:unnamed protein product [Adineta steineri]CAF0784559.1 unnamed protein product [Adineta steineri]CAF3546696.1 unnamed protein product [Adineta steineri]CAF3608880.1 unnamed protein product [Adineta steineri]